MKKSLLSIFLFFTCILQTIPDFVFAKTPNDPQALQWFFTDIGAYKAWDITTGSRDVIVAILDNGFDANQPDIKDNVWINKKEIPKNNIDDDKNGYIDDVSGWNFVSYDLNKNGKLESSERAGNNNPVPDVSALTKSDKEKGYFHHGTLVAGLIGAVGNNKKAGTGLNWNIRLMNLKVLENNGVGDFNPLSRAIYYAVDNGAHVINISAVGDFSKDLDRAIDYAYDHGVVVVAAAGNNANSLNSNPLYPACNDEKSQLQKVLGVSAIDEKHHLAKFSNYGSNCVDITAPGVNMASTLRYDTTKDLASLFADGWNGTSFATPLVSGAAALVKAIQPDWTAPQIYDALLKSVHHTPSTDEKAYTERFGSGLLQVDKAVQYALERLPVSKTIKFFHIYNANTGVLDTLESSGVTSSFKKPFLRKLSLVASFQNGNNNWYITKRFFQGNTLMTVYDTNWNQISRFTVDGVENGDVFIERYLDQSEPQIAFVSKGADPKLLLYSLSGVLLKTQKFEKAKNALFASPISVPLHSFKNIAFLVRNEGKNSIFVFDINAKLVQTVDLPVINGVSAFGIGDLDGDRKSDFVLLFKKGVSAYITILDIGGKVIKQFPVGKAEDVSSTQMFVADATFDKKDDIIIFAKPFNDITIWKPNGMILEHKKIDQSSDPLALIPSF